MSTSLGGAKDMGFKIHVKNSTALPIKRGSVVAIIATAGNPAVSFLDLTQPKDYGAGSVRQLDVPYISVIPTVVDESTTAGARSRLGVVTADIPPSGFGECVAFGICQCIVGVSVAVGEVITSLLGTVTDAANATDKNPMGIALETKTTGELAWCFINCIGNWAGATAAFGGKPY